VSLLWRDEVSLHFGSHGATLTRRKRGLQPQVILEKAVVVTEGTPGDWSQALSAVRKELEGHEWRQANARVVVADHWVRYAVVPWRSELTDDAERLAHGRLILRQIYGDEMGGWTMQLGQTVTGCAQLVCAIPTGLLSDVNAMLQQSALRLVSLRPHLVDAFNRWRSRIPDSGSWFVTVDDGCLAAARLDGDNWVEVHRIRVGCDWAADLNRLRALERLASGGQSPRCRVLADVPPRLRIAEAAIRYGLEWLDPGVTADGMLARLGRIQGGNL
jgi:hypothetical protein